MLPVGTQLRKGVLTPKDNEAARRAEFGVFSDPTRARRARVDRKMEDDEVEQIPENPRLSFRSIPPFRKHYCRGDLVVRIESNLRCVLGANRIFFQNPSEQCKHLYWTSL